MDEPTWHRFLPYHLNQLPQMLEINFLHKLLDIMSFDEVFSKFRILLMFTFRADGNMTQQMFDVGEMTCTSHPKKEDKLDLHHFTSTFELCTQNLEASLGWACNWV